MQTQTLVTMTLRLLGVKEHLKNRNEIIEAIAGFCILDESRVAQYIQPNDCYLLVDGVTDRCSYRLSLILREKVYVVGFMYWTPDSTSEIWTFDDSSASALKAKLDDIGVDTSEFMYLS